MKAFLKYMLLGNPLQNNAKSAKKYQTFYLNVLKYMCEGLCECAVDWVQQNPNIIVPLEVDYNR